MFGEINISVTLMPFFFLFFLIALMLRVVFVYFSNTITQVVKRSESDICCYNEDRIAHHNTLIR